MSIKRTLALILALAMIFSLGVPTYAFAEEGETEESVEALAPVEVIDEIEEAEAISLEPVAETEGNYSASSVAKVDYIDAPTAEFYDTVAEAVAAAKGTEATIKLIADAGEDTIAINGGTKLALDLGGKSLTANFMYVLNGALEIKHPC